LTRALGDQGRSDDEAVEPLAVEVSVEHVAAGSGFVGEHQARGLGLEPTDQLVDVALTGPDRSDEHRWLGALGLGVGHGNGLLVDIQADEKGSRLVHG